MCPGRLKAPQQFVFILEAFFPSCLTSETPLTNWMSSVFMVITGTFAAAAAAAAVSLSLSVSARLLCSQPIRLRTSHLRDEGGRGCRLLPDWLHAGSSSPSRRNISALDCVAGTHTHTSAYVHTHRHTRATCLRGVGGESLYQSVSGGIFSQLGSQPGNEKQVD